MTLNGAYQRIAIAGRQMGGGPMVAAERIVEKVKADEEFPPDGLTPAFGWVLGTAIGLVAAEQEQAVGELAAIEDDWRGS
jgi:hypothetical protein